MVRAKFLDPKAATAAVQVYPSQLTCWQGTAAAMPGAHRHDDLEINLVSHASLRYLFGGTPVEIQPGQVGAFWAAMPHRLIDCPENWRSRVGWLHVPLGIALSWGLPEASISQLLSGRALLCEARDVHRLNSKSLTQWTSDLRSGSPELRQIAMLEIQAVVRRLAVAAGTNRKLREWADADDAVCHAATMARFATMHFRETVTAADIAGAAHLHPNYAMTLFRSVVGTTLGSYLAQCRVAEAQRLLITTNATTDEIAVEAGFGSQSAFYATFSKACGQPPGAYRRSFRGAAQSRR